jgi:hypothetical protein
VLRAFATKRSLPDNKSALVVMAQSAARPIRRMQRARRSGLEFDVMIVFVVLFYVERKIREKNSARVPQSS